MGDGDGDGDSSYECTPEIEALRETIFTPSCAIAGCHSSGDKAGGLDFQAADLEGQLIGQSSGTCDGWIRVVPQSPDESLLYAKIAGPAPCGTMMPPPAGLSPEQSACVRTWIENLEGENCEIGGGNACVDLNTDIQHCGDCANPCPDGIPCVDGSCTCPPGQELCNGECVNVEADWQNCGGCGQSRGTNKVCWMGVWKPHIRNSMPSRTRVVGQIVLLPGVRIKILDCLRYQVRGSSKSSRGR